MSSGKKITIFMRALVSPSRHDAPAHPSIHPSIPPTPFLVFLCITSSSFLTYSVYSCLIPLVTVAVRDLGARNSLLDSLLDVLNQISRVLNTAGDPDKVVEDTSDLALLLGDSGVSH
jgi:hypothetical protein